MTDTDKYAAAIALAQRHNTTKEKSWPLSKNASPINASADTRADATPPSTVEPTSPSNDAASTAAPASSSAACKPVTGQTNATVALTVSTSNPAFASDDSLSPCGDSRPRLSGRAQLDNSDHTHLDDDEEVPEAIAESSLAEVLLWRLGIPADRVRILTEHEKASTTFDLAPPLTPEKIAAAIAQVSIALLNHELEPAEANVMLFALQTMLSAVRVSITADTIRQRHEQQKENSWTTHHRQPRTNATPQIPRRKKTSRSRRPSGSRSASSPTITPSSPKPRSASSRPATSPSTTSRAQRWQALQEGLAAIADATALSPSSLNAAIRITRTLLEPLHVTVTLLGSEATRKYLLLEFHGGEVSKCLNLPEASKPRILPVNDYPSTPEPDKERAS